MKYISKQTCWSTYKSYAKGTKIYTIVSAATFKWTWASLVAAAGAAYFDTKAGWYLEAYYNIVSKKKYHRAVEYIKWSWRNAGKTLDILG